MLPKLQINYISIYVWFVFYSIRIDQPQLNNMNTLNPQNRFATQRPDVCQGKVGQKGWSTTKNWSTATKQQKYIKSKKKMHKFSNKHQCKNTFFVCCKVWHKYVITTKKPHTGWWQTHTDSKEEFGEVGGREEQPAELGSPPYTWRRIDLYQLRLRRGGRYVPAKLWWQNNGVPAKLWWQKMELICPSNNIIKSLWGERFVKRSALEEGEGGFKSEHP